MPCSIPGANLFALTEFLAALPWFRKQGVGADAITPAALRMYLRDEGAHPAALFPSLFDTPPPPPPRAGGAGAGQRPAAEAWVECQFEKPFREMRLTAAGTDRPVEAPLEVLFTDQVRCRPHPYPT